MNNLIKELEMARNQYNAVVEQNKSLQAENRDLKKNRVNVTADATNLLMWAEMYNKADKERYEALLWRDKYKLCLETIEKICSENLQENQCNNCDGVGLDECMDKGCATYQMSKILKQIEKVKGV